MFKAPEKHLYCKTSQSCEAVNNSTLRPEEAESFQSTQLDISRIFHVSNQTSASC